jgi:hypothetical protein
MNTYLNELKEMSNFGLTENGGIKRKSTLNMVYDMFALGGAYRNRSDEDCILLFKNAFEENQNLALKCLFYLRDCRGGQGERRFFRLCYHWLANNYPKIAEKNIENIACYARWDDILYSCVGTKVEKQALDFIAKQLLLDVNSKTPSLLGKWLPSENASAASTKMLGGIVREHLGMTHKQYRKTLSTLRERINIVERLMSENRWGEIEFDKIPSKAGLIYKNAFARRDLIAAKYEAFAKDEKTTVNAGVLYPYEVVAKARESFKCSYGWNSYYKSNLSETDRLMLEKYWNNLKDYFNGKQSNILCVVDTSGSMRGTPIDVAISLGMYCAERAGGPFKDHYISFSSRPQLIKVEGVDFVDKVYRIYQTNLCENTNLTAVFDLLLATAKKSKPEDIPDTICVISDMEIDYMSNWSGKTASTEMEKVRAKWAKAGYKLPRLVYWNVDARQNTILDSGPDVTFVSGMSPAIFESVITGKNGIDLMLDKLLSDRYKAITI